MKPEGTTPPTASRKPAASRRSTEAQRALDRLPERRTALISAAATGQMDVRNTK